MAICRRKFDPRYLVLILVIAAGVIGGTTTSGEKLSDRVARTTVAGGGSGLEGDLASRPNGDGVFLANDLVIARQLAAGIATPQPGSNEFQRADAAPLASRGDGVLNAGDIVQIRRYVAGLDQPNPAGGPTPQPGLTVLYDKLGGPGNWGFDTGNAYQTWFDSAGTDFRVVTQFVGSLSNPVTLRRFEVAMRASPLANPNVSIDLSTFTFKLKIWNASVGTFFSDAFNPSLAGYTLGPINFGSTTVPVGTSVSGRPIFHIGWDNLEIPLPSNVPLEISLQASINSATESVVNYGSIIAGPNMMTAIRIGATGQTNANIGQPMAAKLSVTQ